MSLEYEVRDKLINMQVVNLAIFDIDSTIL